MKKFLLSIFIIGTFAIYSLTQNRNAGADGVNVLAPPGISLAPSTTPTATSSPLPTSVSDGGTPPTPTQATPTPTPKSSPSPTPTTRPTPTPTPISTPTPTPKGQYKDGTYTGPSADAYYGNIQVQAVISGGKLTDVVFLDYPQDRGTSREINSQAMPYLRAEAIQAQSANVNIISGATDSSQAFRQSLAVALSQAKN